MIDHYKTEKLSVKCYHCGENCKKEIIHFDQKDFCCDGCKLVYDLLKENSLCTYYNLNDSPGVSPDKFTYTGKYDYLNNKNVSSKLITFTDGQYTHVVFYIPTIHCSSCIYLLENMHRINKHISNSTVNFLKKQITIIFDARKLQLSEVAGLLSHIGYEPLIHLNDLEKKPGRDHNNQVIKIGLAGFCFGNIMMLSFPDYFSVGNFQDQKNLSYFFGYLNLLLSLPVFFYSASGFFRSAWKSIRYRYLNIDAPIALAIFITFTRSVYEIVSHQGTGYMDSMTGIVFFMLIGRYFQNRTYETLSFERDYKSFFPVGVTVKKNGKEVNQPVSELKKGDRIIIRSNELIPSDAVLLSEHTHIDYSFITGESALVKKKAGEFIYAGGKQADGAIELEIINPTSQSYLTQLWNRDTDNKQTTIRHTYVDQINKYFTITVLSIALLSAGYWLFTDVSKALNALTAVLIIACPCGLLLTSTFANGNSMRMMGRNKFYLKNASVIDQLAHIDTILFDKTGTITHGASIHFTGPELSEQELVLISSLAAQSSHPLSRKIYSQFSEGKNLMVTGFREIPGKGITGIVEGKEITLGSEFFVTGHAPSDNSASTTVFLMIEGEIIGYFSFKNEYRKGLDQLITNLSKEYSLKLISGDNDSEKEVMQTLFGQKADILFNQKPEEKMNYVKQLQQKGHKVMMIGDGLNDAGALKQSDVGVAVSDDTNNFSPACDAILDGSSFDRILDFIHFSKTSKNVIVATFIISVVYNLIGLSFAVQGTLSPVIAAILMPVSSISIVLLTTISTTIAAKRKGL